MASFASITRSTGFRSLGVGRTEHSSAIQPLPVATTLSARSRAGTSRVRSITGGLEGEEEPRPEGPPAPTREELEEAQAAAAEAQRALATATQQVEALQARLEGEQQASRALGDSFAEALDAVQAEMREAYADLILQGCRRLLGSLAESEAIFHSRLDLVSEQLVLESDVVVRVSPEHKRVAEAAIFGRQGWSVEIDPDMDGGCEAICRNSLVDARLDSALAGMEQALRAWLSQDGTSQQST